MPYKFEAHKCGEGHYEIYCGMSSYTDDDMGGGQTLVRVLIEADGHYVSVEPNFNASHYSRRLPKIEVHDTTDPKAAIDAVIAKLQAEQKKRTQKMAKKGVPSGEAA